MIKIKFFLQCPFERFGEHFALRTHLVHLYADRSDAYCGRQFNARCSRVSHLAHNRLFHFCHSTASQNFWFCDSVVHNSLYGSDERNLFR